MINKIVLSGYIFLSLILFSGCGGTSNLSQNKQDFNFILKYGKDAKNVLNTYEGIYTKDMVVDSSITTKLSLSNEDLDSIKNEMLEIKIFEYPETFSPWENDGPQGNIISFVFSYSTYSFKIQMGTKLKEIFWSDTNLSKASKAVKLRNLIRHIVRIIESKEEFKKLPPSQGFYL